MSTPSSPPVRLDDILQKVRGYAPDADLSQIKRAYVFGEKHHSGQMRKSGEPYFSHPMAVADILADLKLDVDCITVALLHDTVEDTPATLEEVEGVFGKDVASMVDGVTKLSKLDYKSAEEHQAENFRKMIFAMAQDIRVILVKLADRCHNMRTLDSMKETKQRSIAQETLDIYAPIANRLGMQAMKAELETLSFRYLHPEAYEKLSRMLEARRPEQIKLIARITEQVLTRLKDFAQVPAVYGRAKSLYSIYRKMVEKGVEVEEISDILAFRVIMDDLGGCYSALGVVHTLWPPISERFKDYIARPKPNGYQSIHTTVICEGERVEVQIRTQVMHDFCENGIAAHWRYKEGHMDLSPEEIERYTRTRHLVQLAEQIKDSQEFLDIIKVDLFAEEVYIYTPKGEVRWFPKGSTPLDFAYSIHTDVGNRCTGARVNGRQVHLGYVLESGERVEIQTSASQKPNRDWLKVVATSRARTKIRQYLRVEEREKAREVGRSLLERELKRYGGSLAKATKDGSLERAAQEMRMGTVADLLLRVGFEKVTVEKVLHHLVPEERLKAPPTEAPQKESRLQTLIRNLTQKSKAGSPVLIDGHDNLLVLFARCCRPLPGDSVMGYISPGRGINIHASNCTHALHSDPGRRVSVEWSKTTDSAATHVATLEAITLDQPGVLANLTRVVGNLKVNISKAVVRTTRDKRGVIIFDLMVRDLAQLVSVQNAMEAVKGVISVTRVRAA